MLKIFLKQKSLKFAQKNQEAEKMKMYLLTSFEEANEWKNI